MVPLIFNSKTKHEDLVNLVMRDARLNASDVTPGLVHSLGTNDETAAGVERARHVYAHRVTQRLDRDIGVLEDEIIEDSIGI